MFKQGRDLTTGDLINLISGDAGVANLDEGTKQYIVTDQTDKRGNKLLVDTETGTTAYASPLSVWQKRN